MSSELESGLEKFFVERVRLVGGYTFKFVPLTAGMPDRICIFPGGVIAVVELKREGEDTSAIQRVWHGRFQDKGVHVHVLEGRKEVVDWLRKIVAARDPKGKPGPKPRAQVG